MRPLRSPLRPMIPEPFLVIGTTRNGKSSARLIAPSPSLWRRARTSWFRTKTVRGSPPPAMPDVFISIAPQFLLVDPVTDRVVDRASRNVVIYYRQVPSAPRRRSSDTPPTMREAERSAWSAGLARFGSSGPGARWGTGLVL